MLKGAKAILSYYITLSCLYQDSEEITQVFESTDGGYDKDRKLGGLKLIKAQFLALLVKRFHHTRRNRKGFLSQVKLILCKDTFHLSELACQTGHFADGIPQLKAWLYTSSLNFFKMALTFL